MDTPSRRQRGATPSRRTVLVALSALMLLVAFALTDLRVTAGARSQPQQQADTTFRGATTIVPIDVRVIDDRGQPVTDLTAVDFTIIENGVPQTLRHFSAQRYATEAPSGVSPSAATAVTPSDQVNGPPATPDAAASDAAPVPVEDRPLPSQEHRAFLLVLGRGRLQVPANGVDGLIHFVRNRLLPNDRVAVVAWNRATEFTTDHERIAELLERFKRQHEGIEGKLSLQTSGLAGVYGSRDVPAALQNDIDDVFGGPRGVGTQTLEPVAIPDADRIEEDARRTVDLLQTPAGTSPSEQAEAAALGLSLDEFVSRNTASMQDVAKLYAGVRYLRRVEGEKHLLFVAEHTPMLPRVEDERSLAFFASDARVAIHYIHTGGLSLTAEGRGGRGPDIGARGGGGGNRGRGTGPGAGGGERGRGPGVAGGRGEGEGRRGGAAARGAGNAGGRRGGAPGARGMSGNRMVDNFDIARTLADVTGGQFYANRVPTVAAQLDAIDAVTRFGYLLGYHPSDPNRDGTLRRIEVRVNRPGLRVFHRHGYYARDAARPSD